MTSAIIGVGTGGARQYFILETLLKFIHAAQITVIAVYITFAPPQPKMKLLPTPIWLWSKQN